jgi:uncharacterized membrane protein
MNTSFTWVTEIVDESENRYIVWRSMPDSLVESASSVEFREAPGGRGTELIVAMHYSKIGNYVGETVAQVLGAAPERILREELRHFKQLLEAGEIPTTEGQPSGRRSAVLETGKKITRMPQRIAEKTA